MNMFSLEILRKKWKEQKRFLVENKSSMKKKISLLLVLFLVSFTALSQSKSDNYTKIDKQVEVINQLKGLTVLEIPNAAFKDVQKYNSEERMQVSFKKNELVKIFYYAKQGNAGGYETMTIYLRNKKPIFFEKETKETITARHTDGKVESFQFINKSKTYIQNWKKSQIFYLMLDEDADSYQLVKPEMSDIIFKTEKMDILRLIQLIEDSRKKN